MLASAADEHGVQTSSYCTYQHDCDHPAKALTENEVEREKKETISRQSIPTQVLSIPTPPNLPLLLHSILLLHRRAPHPPLLPGPLLALGPARQPRRHGRQRRERHVRGVRSRETCCERGSEQACRGEIVVRAEILAATAAAAAAATGPRFEVGCFCGGWGGRFGLGGFGSGVGGRGGDWLGRRL